MNLSQLWTINVRDFFGGLAAAVGIAVLNALWQLLSACVTVACIVTSFNWSSLENAAVAAFIGYIGVKLSTDQNGKLFGKI